ncbi:MAG TPA: ATP-binding protein [Acidimicrobiales bacterium]
MESQIELDPTVSQVAVARQFVHDALVGWDGDHDTHTTILLTSELVTNAVIHAQSAIGLTIRYEPPRVTVEVHDDSDRLPLDLVVDSAAGGGRGVHLVSLLADDWGVRSIPGQGKVVWFTLGPR